MFSKVLIANRGEVACRIIRTLRRLGIGSVAVYSEADADARHVDEADEGVCIGPASAAKSYLNPGAIIEAARQKGAEAVHPGYGFLSGTPDFVEACEKSGLVFIGPTAEQLRRFRFKHEARDLARQLEVPLLSGSGILAGLAEARREADRVGYPLMLKSTAGRGGIGMCLCRSDEELEEGFVAISRQGESGSGERGVFLETFVEAARHIEVQIFGDGHGGVAVLGERDCSVQRRHGKLVEETPAPNLSSGVRQSIYAAAAGLGRAVSYRSAGTVEFVYDVATERFYFLEVNTGLSVAHGVTEAVAGIDLVEWMVRLAAGERLPVESYRHVSDGHSVQVRICAENPSRDFEPGSGLITDSEAPAGVRCDTSLESGTEVSSCYDTLLAKVIVHEKDRPVALERMREALEGTRLYGVQNTIDLLRQLMDQPSFVSGEHTTGILRSFQYNARTVDVVQPGTQTSVQAYPGRRGYWHVGVPPSGPMDFLAFRLGNRVLGNPEEAAGLEMTLSGPTLQFHRATSACLTGARMDAELNGRPVPWWRPFAIPAGGRLRIRGLSGPGCRAYLTIAGGFDVPEYLGSKATFSLGQFGGHCGRNLRAGDALLLGGQEGLAMFGAGDAVPSGLIPVYGEEWEIGVIYGPHGAPDFFTDEDMETFFSTSWEVHYNSARTGVRLIGPKPKWARLDGGEAGLHPSNIHDCAYAVGTVDFTGDMPVILGPDGPSLGGFVCPATVVTAELWKLGQLRPGARVRFRPISARQAAEEEKRRNREIASLAAEEPERPVVMVSESGLGPVLRESPACGDRVAVTYRPAGDKYLLVEYGPMRLDLNLRFRVHALMEWLRANRITGILELTPGIRSLQVHYDNQALPADRLVELLAEAEDELPAVEAMEVPTRVVHLPLSWDDESTRRAIRKYMQVVRDDAPWCPSNIEFIRRINGLNSIDDVRRILFEATYLVMGLGDVYLGAPVATPVDPRHRLVTTKYNPARTWTPENAVGIGGAYLCVYGMEGPGGYQFVGRTLQMWNRYRVTKEFPDGQPWLLRFFDQIRFYPVDSVELEAIRRDFPRGRFRLKMEEETFSLSRYNAFLRKNAASIMSFKRCQQDAFERERESWAAANGGGAILSSTASGRRGISLT